MVVLFLKEEVNEVCHYLSLILMTYDGGVPYGGGDGDYDGFVFQVIFYALMAVDAGLWDGDYVVIADFQALIGRSRQDCVEVVVVHVTFLVDHGGSETVTRGFCIKGYRTIDLIYVGHDAYDTLVGGVGLHEESSVTHGVVLTSTLAVPSDLETAKEGFCKVGIKPGEVATTHYGVVEGGKVSESCSKGSILLSSVDNVGGFLVGNNILEQVREGSCSRGRKDDEEVCVRTDEVLISNDIDNFSVRSAIDSEITYDGQDILGDVGVY